MSKQKQDDVELIETTSEKIKIIRERLKVAKDRQKSYADTRRRELEFEVGDMVFLKVAFWKRVNQFQKRGMLKPRYIGLLKILERIRSVAYRLELL